MPEVPLMATGGRFQKRVDPWCHLLLKQRHQCESTVTSWHQHHWTILAAVDELAKYNIRKNDPKKHYNYIYSLSVLWRHLGVLEHLKKDEAAPSSGYCDLCPNMNIFGSKKPQ